MWLLMPVLQLVEVVGVGWRTVIMVRIQFLLCSSSVVADVAGGGCSLSQDKNGEWTVGALWQRSFGTKLHSKCYMAPVWPAERCSQPSPARVDGCRSRYLRRICKKQNCVQNKHVAWVASSNLLQTQAVKTREYSSAQNYIGWQI